MKYEIGQLIYYLRDNEVRSAKVLARTTIENLNDYNSLGTEEIGDLCPWGKDGTWYNTIHGIISEERAFPSKEELLNSL